MMDLSDEEYQTLQTALANRADKQSSTVIDDASIQKALDHTKSMGLPDTVMHKLRFRDGNSKESGGSDFVEQIKKMSGPALHSVLEGLIQNGPTVVKDALTPKGLGDVCSTVFQAAPDNKCEELSEGLANLPNQPAFKAVMGTVGETSQKMHRMMSG
eukprot:g11001.t1